MNKKVSCSPERGSFTKSMYIRKLNDPDVSEEEKQQSLDLLDYIENLDFQLIERQETKNWKENNLEYDLRSTEWILEKVRNSDSYAQNLYAALCNNNFQRNEVMPILKDQTWGCSWRHAGGIIADMREQGDYIDWYCSGIKHNDEPTEFIGEGKVTEEIQADLFKLGWIVVNNPD